MTQVVGCLQRWEVVHDLPAKAGEEGCSRPRNAGRQLLADLRDGIKRFGEGKVVRRPVEMEEVDGWRRRRRGIHGLQNGHLE